MRHGMVFGSRYQLDQLIGRGGTCCVWSAYDVTTQRRFAVKILLPHLKGDKEVVRRFAREVIVLRRCDPRFVPRVEAFGIDERNGPYLVMELLKGETMERMLSRVGALKIADFLPLAHDVSRGMSHLHWNGIIHRDLKPANVFILSKSEEGIGTKLLDLGTVKDAETPHDFCRTAAGVLVGTPSRMSPEQASGLPVDRRTDIWAFGMLAFEAIVGSPAVDGTMPPGQIVLSICRGNLPVPSQLNASIPAGFDEWFARSTMRNPADRFLSIDEQMSVLDDVLCRRFREKDIKTQVIRAQPCRTMTLPPLVKRSLATGSSYVALQASVVGVNPR